MESLDEMLGGEGLFRGSSVLISGTAGTGKSTIAAQFCAAACERGERALYFAFEESEPQIIRNMKSVGIDLQRWVDAGCSASAAFARACWAWRRTLPPCKSWSRSSSRRSW